MRWCSWKHARCEKSDCRRRAKRRARATSPKWAVFGPAERLGNEGGTAVTRGAGERRPPRPCGLPSMQPAATRPISGQVQPGVQVRAGGRSSRIDRPARTDEGALRRAIPVLEFGLGRRDRAPGRGHDRSGDDCRRAPLVPHAWCQQHPSTACRASVRLSAKASNRCIIETKIPRSSFAVSVVGSRREGKLGGRGGSDE